MSKRGIFVVVACLLFLLRSGVGQSPATAAPDTSPAAENDSSSDFQDSLQWSGAVDVYYSWNNNQPLTQQNQLYNFDDRSGGLDLNMAELEVQRIPSKALDWGFNAELISGNVLTLIRASDPTRNDVALSALLPLYVSFKPTSWLQLDAGKFQSPLGAEVIETQKNWNYSRSLLFGLAAPYFHTGLRVTATLSPSLKAFGMVAQGWNNVKDNNRGKTFAAGVSWAPSRYFNIAQNVLSGPETTGDSAHFRTVTDTIVGSSPLRWLDLNSNYDWGEDRLAHARWQGVALYARMHAGKKWAFSPRVEWYSDPQGFTTGAVQTLREATFTADYQIFGVLLLRLETRSDWSSQAVYQKPVGLVNTQTTGTGALIFSF